MRSVVLVLLLLAGSAGLAQATPDSALAKAKTLPDVVDARLDERGTLWLMVKNQEANWDKYAAVTCKLMQPHHARIFAVRVVDFTSVGRFRTSEDWKQLGAAKCGS